MEELEEALKGEVGEEENGSEASLHQSLTSRKLVSMGHFEKTITSLQHEVKGVYDQQVTMAGRFHRDLNNIKSLLKEMISQQQQPVHTGNIMHPMLGAIQVLRNADGGGGCQIFWEKALRRCKVQCY